MRDEGQFTETIQMELEPQLFDISSGLYGPLDIVSAKPVISSDDIVGYLHS